MSPAFSSGTAGRAAAVSPGGEASPVVGKTIHVVSRCAHQIRVVLGPRRNVRVVLCGGKPKINRLLDPSVSVDDGAESVVYRRKNLTIEWLLGSHRDH